MAEDYARQVFKVRAQVEEARVAVTRVEAPELLSHALALKDALRHLAAARAALFLAGGTLPPDGASTEGSRDGGR